MMELGSLVFGLGFLNAFVGFPRQNQGQRAKTKDLNSQLFPQPQLQTVHLPIVSFVIVARQVQ
jgi:hypothetical protein